MNLVTQVFQAHTLVTWMLGDELGHHAPQGLIAIVIILELLEFGHHRVPALEAFDSARFDLILMDVQMPV